MINVQVFIDQDGRILGFDADNHGRDIVCSAVSALMLNTANCLEALTEEDYTLEYDKDGGHFSLRIEEYGHDAEILLNALYIGLSGIAAEYPEELNVEDIE